MKTTKAEARQRIRDGRRLERYVAKRFDGRVDGRPNRPDAITPYIVFECKERKGGKGYNRIQAWFKGGEKHECLACQINCLYLNAGEDDHDNDLVVFSAKEAFQLILRYGKHGDKLIDLAMLLDKGKATDFLEFVEMKEEGEA